MCRSVKAFYDNKFRANTFDTNIIEVVKDLEQIPGLMRNTFWISGLLKSKKNKIWQKAQQAENSYWANKSTLWHPVGIRSGMFLYRIPNCDSSWNAGAKLWLRFCIQNPSFYIESKVHLKTAPQPERVAPQLQKWGAVVLHLRKNPEKFPGLPVGT